MCQVQTFSSRFHVRGCPSIGKYEPKTPPKTAGVSKYIIGYRKINDNSRCGASTATESEPRPVSVIHGRKEKGGRSPARTTYPVLGLVVPRSGYGHSRLFRLFRAAFQYADDREEREANGAESGDYARRDEKFLLVRGFLEQKDSKEQAD